MENQSKEQIAHEEARSPSTSQGLDSALDTSSPGAKIPTPSASDTGLPGLPTLEANINANIRPGNAFAQMKAKENRDSMTSEKDCGKN